MGGIGGSCGGLDQGQADVMCKLSFSFSEFIQVVSRPYPFEREGESEKREIERVEREREESEREERERGEREKYETDLPCAPASQAPPQCRVLLRGHDHGRVGSTGSHVLRLQPESWPTCASPHSPLLPLPPARACARVAALILREFMSHAFPTPKPCAVRPAPALATDSAPRWVHPPEERHCAVPAPF